MTIHAKINTTNITSYKNRNPTLARASRTNETELIIPKIHLVGSLKKNAAENRSIFDINLGAELPRLQKLQVSCVCAFSAIADLREPDQRSCIL